jgi:hypothetical protein
MRNRVLIRPPINTGPIPFTIKVVAILLFVVGRERGQYYCKRTNCYMLEQCGVDFRIPLTPPFSKGEISYSPLWKRGVRGDSIELEIIRLY